MKIMMFTRYGRMGASSRLRALQFIPDLEKVGIECRVSPLISDADLQIFYSKGKRSISNSLLSYIRRFAAVLVCWRYDKVWIEKELFPFFPASFERLLAIAGVAYIVDYDDAVFHSYDQSRNPLIAFFLRRKIDVVMAKSGVVTAGNHYIADRARRAGAPQVVYIPTVVDHSRYRPAFRASNKQKVVGWIGSPATRPYIEQLSGVLAEICSHFGARLLLVGANSETFRFKGFPVEVRPWSEATEARDISEMDIGIMPLPDGPWERGKCGYKLIQYMASGVCVCASPVGINVDIVKNTGSGLLADSPDDWREALTKLLSSAALREQMGRSGREAVQRFYSVESQLPLLIELFGSRS